MYASPQLIRQMPFSACSSPRMSSSVVADGPADFLLGTLRVRVGAVAGGLFVICPGERRQYLWQHAVVVVAFE